MPIRMTKPQIMTSLKSQVAGSFGRFHVKHSRLPPFVVNVAALVASIILISSIVVQRGFNCLKISSIEIPSAVWNGSQVTLVCNYELAPNDQLYSVKWYKNYVEFYRFQPQPADQQAQAGGQSGASSTLTTAALQGGGQADDRQQPDSRWQQGGSEQAAAPGPIQEGQNLNLNYVAGPESKHEFELDGISLDLAKSNATHVQLNRAQLSSEATYKCEVSADSPTFATVSAERQMKVYVLPKQKLALLDNSLGQSVHQRQQQQLATIRSNKNNEPPPATAPFLSSSSGSIGDAGAMASSKQLIYQLNDLINFTCVSGPSRPAAQLTWRLNDEPILSLFPSQTTTAAKTNASEHQQQQQQQQQQQTISIREKHKLLANELIETRSTLTVRLQAAQLKLLLRRQTVSAIRGASGLSQPTGSSGHPHSSSMSILPLKLSCLAKLSIQFSSETSVLVSNGRPAATTTPESTRAAGGQRRRNSNAYRSLAEPGDGSGQRPVASSLVDGQTQEPDTYSTAQSGDRRHGVSDASDQDNQADGDELLPYRWPPAGVAAGRQRGPSAGLWSVASFSDAWRSAPAAPDSSLATGSSAPHNPVRSGGRRGYQNEVWTLRQLAEQSEHIGQIIERARPNELEAPHIEAKSIVAAAASKRERNDNEPGAASAQLMQGGSSSGDAKQEDPDSDGDGGGDSDDADEGAGGSPATSPSIVISSNQFGHDNQFTDKTNYSTTQLDPAVLSSGASKSPPDLRQDYRLDELVNFTCHPVMAGRYPGQEHAYGDGDFALPKPFKGWPKKPLFAIQIKWLINNQEITGNKVNAVAGDRFYYTAAPLEGIANDNGGASDRPTGPEMTTFSSLQPRGPPTDADIVVSDQVGSAATSDYSNWRHPPDSDGTTSDDHHRPKITSGTIAAASPPPATSSGSANWLLIEFTPSLLQLKEFNLKCKTIIEQPLSVVDSSQILSLATSPFIQVVQDHQAQQTAMQSRANGGRHSSMFNVKEHPRRQKAAANGTPGQYQSSVGLNNYDYSGGGQQHRHRSNVIRMRQSSGIGSSAAATTATASKIDPRAQLKLACLLLLHHLFVSNCYSLLYFN